MCVVDLARVRGLCPVGKGQYSTPAREPPASSGHTTSQIGAFSPEGVPYGSIETYLPSPSMPFGRALLWNIQMPSSAHAEACNGPRHRQGCLPLVLILSCPAVGRLVLSAYESVVHAAQIQSNSSPQSAASPDSITGLLGASLECLTHSNSTETYNAGTPATLGTFW